VQRSVELFSFSECEKLAREIAKQLDLDLHLVDVHTFPDGESLVRAKSETPGSAILFRSLDHPNEKLIELLLAADALRRQGVGQLGLVCPYLGYMRQDRVFEAGQALSQHVVANLLGTVFDDVLTVEAHLHRIQALSEVFPCRARSISAAPVIADWLRKNTQTDLVVGPDSESEPWVRAIAEEAKLDWAVASKSRQGDRVVEVDLPALSSDARRVFIVDDVGSSGATLEAVARILRERGITEIGAVVVHALFDADTPERLRKSGIESLISTNSIIHASNAISLASLLAAEIERRSTPDEVA
jgi:ribose-phosphate pyrophosphokinase